MTQMQAGRSKTLSIVKYLSILAFLVLILGIMIYDYFYYETTLLYSALMPFSVLGTLILVLIMAYSIRLTHPKWRNRWSLFLLILGFLLILLAVSAEKLFLGLLLQLVVLDVNLATMVTEKLLPMLGNFIWIGGAITALGVLTYQRHRYGGKL